MYPWHETGQVKGFLYLVETPCLPTWVKIGFSNNVDRRIKELNTAVPVPFRLIQAWASNYIIVQKRRNEITQKLSTLITLESALRT